MNIKTLPLNNYCSDYNYETKQWHRFDKAAGTSTSSSNHVDIQKIWDHAAVHLLKGHSGYKIEFSVYCCFEQLRLSNGKNKLAFDGRQLPYVMPIKNSIEQPAKAPVTPAADTNRLTNKK